MQHHGQWTVPAGKPVRCPWCWAALRRSSTRPLLLLTYVPPVLPSGQVIHILILVSVYKDYLRLRPPRSKKQAIIAVVCNTIRGIVKKAWEASRIWCRGVTVLHMWEKKKKTWKPFKSSAATVFQSRSTCGLTCAIISHAQLQCASRGFVWKRPEWKHKWECNVFFKFSARANMALCINIAFVTITLWIQVWTMAHFTSPTPRTGSNSFA